MYAGRIVESGPDAGDGASRRHPYTMGLMNAFARSLRDALELVPIEGSAARPRAIRRPAAASRRAVPSRCRPARSAARVGQRSRPATRRPACATAKPTPSAHAAMEGATWQRSIELRDVAKHFPVARRWARSCAANSRRCAPSTASIFDSGAATASASSGEFGQRQDHARTAAAEAHRADGGHASPSRASSSAGMDRRAPARFRQPGAARLPEPLRCAQSALHRPPRRGRTAAQYRRRPRRARGRASAEALAPGAPA